MIHVVRRSSLVARRRDRRVLEVLEVLFRTRDPAVAVADANAKGDI